MTTVTEKKLASKAAHTCGDRAVSPKPKPLKIVNFQIKTLIFTKRDSQHLNKPSDSYDAVRYTMLYDTFFR